MTKPEGKDRVHHPYSPSTLMSLEACPCFQSRHSDHIRSIIGTIAHKVTETREDDQRLEDRDSAAAAECLDFYDKHRLEMYKEKGATPVLELLETYLTVDDCTIQDPVYGEVKSTTGGYVDRAILSWDRKRAKLFDWKFGFWPVEEARHNLQGIAYAIGLFRAYSSLEQITFYFKQPHLNSVTEATFLRSQVAELYLRVQTVVERARSARAAIAKGDWSMANPKVPACNFCANLGSCPKVCELACQVGKKFYPLGLPDDITPNKVMAPDQTTLALRLAMVMSTWAGAMRTQVSNRVFRREAQCPEGFTIQTASRRSLKDKRTFKQVALQYLTPEEYNETLDVSFGAVEEQINDKSPRGQKKATVEKFQAHLLESGAVEQGEEYAFLRAVASKEDKNKNDDNINTQTQNTK